MKPPRLVITSGPDAGKEFELREGVITIGRNPDNRIHLNDMQVSRYHAELHRTEAGFVLRDRDSGNGTFVGGHQVLEYGLSHGDAIQIGPFALRYEGSGQTKVPVTKKLDDGREGKQPAIRFDDSGLTQDVKADDAENVFQTLFGAESSAAPDSDSLVAAQNRLKLVYEANQIIASERDLDRLFARVMDQIFGLVPAHNGVILLRDTATGRLESAFVQTRGEGEMVVSSTAVERAYKNGEAVISFDAAGDDRWDGAQSIITQSIASIMCTPLVHQGERLGVIYVDARSATNAFSHGDLEMLVGVAGAAATAIKNAQYVEDLRRAYHDTLIALSNAIELRDHYTVGHTWRVTKFAQATARELGWSEEKIQQVEMGGLMHDIGKIAVADSVLRKPGPLTDEEFAMMQVHPERGARLLQDIAFLQPLIPYALYHHERYDGRGYPNGHAGEDIPIEGRLVAVADTFDAMTSHRPYRKGLAPEVAREEIKKNSGTQFDPAIVEAFLKAYDKGAIHSILQEYQKEGRSVACAFCSTYNAVAEDKQAGDIITCTVCHRRLLLRLENGSLFADLQPGTEAHLQPRVQV